MPYTKAVSYSGLSLYRQCPHRWHDNYVLGNRQPSGAAADRGTYIHELLEDYFLGKTPYPSGNALLKKWTDQITALMAHSPTAEGEVAVSRDWAPVSFADPVAYVRGKVDLTFQTAARHIYDWKTGKVYPTHAEQGQVYVALSPECDDYVVQMWYLDQPHHIAEWKYTRKDRDEIIVKLVDEVDALRSATEYPATPNDGCQWCHLSWRNGGDCKRAR